jgi:cytochrome c oxidase subunit IV
MTANGGSVRRYVLVAATLMGLLGLTLVLALVDLGPLNFPAAMTIAVAKAGLVVVFFMHVRSGPRVVRIAAMAGLFWLAFMFVLMLSDFLTRS